MSDKKTINSQIKSRGGLEPLSEKDLDLAGKFGHSKKGELKTHNLENEKEKKKLAEKEIVGEKLKVERDDAYQQILSKVKKKVTDDNNGDVVGDAKKISQTDAESQIQTLVDLAMTKGVVYAVKVAKHLEDNYVLDMLHDNLLADELHKSLEEKGLLQ